MIIPPITPLDETKRPLLQQMIDNIAKPKGSLGKIESTAIQICMIQQTATPILQNPYNIVFAADHGVVEEHISQSPKSVTYEVVVNMATGGAGICFLCRQHGFQLRIVDAGIDYDLNSYSNVINRRIGQITKNYCYQPAMNYQEMQKAITYGAIEVDYCFAQDCNIISFGEMGITNTAASSVWMSLLTKIPLIECVGRGSGLNDEGVKHRYEVLLKAINRCPKLCNPLDIMMQYGGFEMVMAVGAMLQAASHRMIIIVDGFIMTVCALMAQRISPASKGYFIYGHLSGEKGHQLLLEYMGVEPLLQLGMRLGEGSGAVCAYPIIDSSVRMLREMATFGTSKVTKYF